MKIFYLADAWSIHTRKWLQFFADQGHEIHLASLRDWEGHPMPQVQLYRLIPNLGALPGIGLAKRVMEVRRLIRYIQPDLVHAHYVEGYGTWGALTGFQPFVVTAWGSDILKVPATAKLRVAKLKMALRRAQIVTCDAEHMSNRLVEMGTPADKIRRIYFGVDTEKFHPDARDRSWRQSLGLADDMPTVISLRGLNPVYDLESLVRATPLILRAVPRARILIAGDGTQRELLQTLAAELGCTAAVSFLGQIANDLLPKYLTGSDVYVSTSTSDAGLAGSTAEAMACGLPVVTTDFGDNGHWVHADQGGLLVPLRDPKSLAESVVCLLQNESKRRAFGQHNRAVIEERNSYRKEMGKMETIYLELHKEARS